MEFVQSLQHNILKKSPKQSAIIIDLLSSKNKKNYVDNLDEYKSYLELNSGKEDAVEKLDSLVNAGKFKHQKYDSKLAVRTLMQNKKLSELFGDMENDIGLLREAGWGVCLINGSDATKAVAQAITEYSVEEDGVGKYLEMHWFNREGKDE